MAFVDSLRKVFGWSGSKPPPEKKFTLRDQLAAQEVYNAMSPAETYYGEVTLRLQHRRDRYDVYDAMDQMADVSSVLDAYAEDATQLDQEHEKTVWVESDDKRVKNELMTLFHDVLHVEDWIEGAARDTGKYGDNMAMVFATQKDGVQSLRWRDPRDIERVENADGILIGFEETALLQNYQQRVTLAKQNGEDISKVTPTYKPWDLIHFRLYKRLRMPGEKIHNIYGTSLLMGSERIAKQVRILDDLLMIMRLTRSLDRKTYYVDPGRVSVEEEVKTLKRWKRALKRKSYLDPSSGKFDSRFDPFAWTEDEFWSAREGTTSRVETTPGITNIADIVDIDHFRDKFFGSLRAPKAYFGYEGDVNAKATLSSQSLKWARAVFSVQRALIQGLTRLAQIHLAYRGLDTDATKFQVMITEASLVALLDKLEAWQGIVDVADRMSTLGENLGINKRDWSIYIMRNVLWLSDQEVKQFARKMPKEIPPAGQPVEPPTWQGTEQPPTLTAPTTSNEPPPEKQPPEEQPEQPPPGESRSNGGSHRLEEIDAAIMKVAHTLRMRKTHRRLHGIPEEALPDKSDN